MTAEPIIRLEHIRIQFGSLVVHRDVSLSIPEGQVVTILGPSGTGKTLLLKTIIGLLKPDSGNVRVFGQELCNLDERALRQVRRQIGMLFQGAALFDSLSVHENIAYSLREFGEKDEQKIRSIVMERLAVVDLEHVVEKYPPQLSGGQKKRVGLARALASSPRIVLFDEPTTGLDPTSIRRIDDLVLRLKNEYGITCVVVTHDIESARRISDRWILINDGVIIAEGPSRELAERNPDVIRFVQGEWRDAP
jgi:phospholipid/cholesterol/gamma-HCH transport system ATP-binding protein